MKLLGRIIGKICGRKYQSRMFDEDITAYENPTKSKEIG